MAAPLPFFSAKWNRHFQAFRDDFPECRPIFVYLGHEPLLVDGIRCVPCEAFLRGIRPTRKTIG